MQILIYIILYTILTSCSPQTLIKNPNSTTNTNTTNTNTTNTLLPPIKDNPTFYQDQKFVNNITSSSTDLAWDYIRTNITATTAGTNTKALIIDSAIYKNQPLIQNKINKIFIVPSIYPEYEPYYSLGQDIIDPFTNQTTAKITAIQQDILHGTRISSIITGSKYTQPIGGTSSGLTEGTSFIGGAPNSKIDFMQTALFNIVNNNSTNNLHGLSYILYYPQYLNQIIIDNKYNVINMSFAEPQPVSDVSNAWKNLISTIIEKNDILIAIATGNSPNITSYQDPQYPAILSKEVNTTFTTGISLAVTGSEYTRQPITINNTTQYIPNFNLCGTAGLYCLAAPFSIKSPILTFSTDNKLIENQFTTSYGTSYSTALVSAAALTIKSTFPTLTMKEISMFILRGADPKYDNPSTNNGFEPTIPEANKRKIGQLANTTPKNTAYSSSDISTSAVYGYGTLNVFNTVKLIQSTKFTTTTSTSSDTTIYTSPSIFHTLQNSPSTQSVQTYDEYGTYTLSLSNNIKILPLFDTSSQISNIIRNNLNQNFNETSPLGNIGYISAFNSISLKNNPQTSNLSYTNHEINSQMMHLGIDPSQQNSQQTLTQSTFGINKQIGNLHLSFQNNFNPYSQHGRNITQTSLQISQSNPLLFPIFGNTFNNRFLQLSSKFNKTLIEFQTIFGESNSFQTINGTNMTPSNNLATSISISQHNPSSTFLTQTGIISESNTLLGMYSSGALTLGNNNLTTFNKIFARKQTPHFSIFGSTTLSITQPGTPYTPSLFQNTSNIISRSFIIGIEKPILGGNLELTYSQPLSIISGTTQLNQHNLSLTSSYQEQDLGLCFSKTNKTSSLSIQALYIQNRYNINNGNTFGGILTYKKHFK